MNESDILINSAPKSLFLENGEFSPNSADFESSEREKSLLSDQKPDTNFKRDLERQLLDTYLLGKSKKTQETYTRIICEFFEFIAPHLIQDSTISTLSAFLEIKKHQAHESKRLRLAVIRSFFSYATQTGYLKKNVASFLPKMEVHHKISERYLTQEEVIRMIALTNELRDRVILKVLYSAGLRLTELISLNWEHVQERDENGGQLLVLGKGNKKRVIVISSGVFLELLTLKTESTKSSEPVFTSREWGSPRISKRAIQVIVDKARLRAGIVKKVSPHWLRHGHASHALDRGAPIHLVQSTLGHASVATTGKYLHSRPQESSSRFLGV